MGGSTSIQYSVPVGEKGEDCTPIMRHPQFKDELLSTPDPKLTTMKDILREKFKKYPKSHCLGMIFVKLRENRPTERRERIHRVHNLLRSYG
jgi:ERCC4-related helicase